MVKKEHPAIINGKEYPDLIRFYSDIGKVLIQVQTNDKFEEAVDTYPSRYDYVESEEFIVKEESDEFIVKEESDEFIVKEESDEIIV